MLMAGVLLLACTPSAKKAPPATTPRACDASAAFTDVPKFSQNQLKEVRLNVTPDMQYGVSTFSADVDETSASLTDSGNDYAAMLVKGRITIESTTGSAKQTFFPYSLGEGLPVVTDNNSPYGQFIAAGEPVL